VVHAGHAYPIINLLADETTPEDVIQRVAAGLLIDGQLVT